MPQHCLVKSSGNFKQVTIVTTVLSLLFKISSYLYICDKKEDVHI